MCNLRQFQQMPSAYNSQSLNPMMANLFCPKCNGIPHASYDTGETFTTHICYPHCGYVFWTLKICPNCKHPEKTVFLKKPNFGQRITCENCKANMYYFRCPQRPCQALFFKNQNAYSMGSRLHCQTCRHEYKTIVCPCGGDTYFDKNKKLMEGHDIYKCKCCEKDMIYTICPHCTQPQYHLERLEIGERIRCGNCKVWRKYVPCPECGKTLKSNKFSFCEINRCDHCNCSFEYSRCPYGCGINYYLTNRPLGPIRHCNACRHDYYVLNCNKCENSIYLEDLEKSVAVIDHCPSCRNIFQFYMCSCGVFNSSGLSCLNQKCAKKPSQVIDRTKQEKQKEKAKEGEEEMVCKICYANLPVMINDVCGHLLMCEKCVNDYRRAQKGHESMPCPVCKTIGKYFKYREPIYS